MASFPKEQQPINITGSTDIQTGISPTSVPQPGVKPATGALSALDPSNAPFNFDRLSYPMNDLGEGKRYPHYISFYINEREQSKYFEQKRVDVQNRESVIQQNARQTASYNNINLNIAGTNIGFRRKTSRTTQSIRLYMPDTMHWTFRNQWKDISLTDSLPFTKSAELIGDIMSAVKSGVADGGNYVSAVLDGIKNAKILGVEKAANVLGMDRDVALSSLGYAINPNIDVIYGAPELRTFIFDFMFAPRNVQEANQVLAIIKAFKFYAAPESVKDSSFGRYFIPPTEFDIEFSVQTMGKISTCVMESIDVDYAPTGWSAYSHENPKNDMPTNIRLQLAFRELEYITKERVFEGF